MFKFDPCNLSNLGVEDGKSVSNVSEIRKNSLCKFKFEDASKEDASEHEAFKSNTNSTLMSFSRKKHQKTQNTSENWKYPVENKIDTMLDDILTKEGKPLREYKIDLCLRKDVVNKNLLRIISRYFKELLSQKVPNFKDSFRNPRDLDLMLTEFSEQIMGKGCEPNLKYILGSFVVAPKMKQL